MYNEALNKTGNFLFSKVMDPDLWNILESAPSGDWCLTQAAVEVEVELTARLNLKMSR